MLASSWRSSWGCRPGTTVGPPSCTCGCPWCASCQLRSTRTNMFRSLSNWTTVYVRLWHVPNLHVNTVHNWHQKRNTYVYVNLVLLKTHSSWVKVYQPTNIYQEIDSAERLNSTLYEARDDLVFHDVTDDTVDVLWGQSDLGTLGEDLVEAALVDVNEGQFGAPLSHLLRCATADLTTST